MMMKRLVRAFKIGIVKLFTDVTSERLFWIMQFFSILGFFIFWGIGVMIGSPNPLTVAVLSLLCGIFIGCLAFILFYLIALLAQYVVIPCYNWCLKVWEESKDEC